jgi:hypothetical protein
MENYYRPLSKSDLVDLAEYLYGTDESVEIALSELGFDPDSYPEIEDWLREIGLVRDLDSSTWRNTCQ